MHELQRLASSTRVIRPGEVAGFIDAMEPHEVRCLAGLDAVALADRLALAPRTRRAVLRLDLGDQGDADCLIARAVDGLARAVSSLWPYLWGGEDLSALRDDALTLAHLPLRLEALAARHPGLSRAWGAEILPRLLRGAAPRLAGPSPAVEWAQLALAFAPDGLVIAVPWRGTAAAAFVAATEWLARNAAVSVLVFAERLPADPVFERPLFGAAAIADALETPEPQTPRDAVPEETQPLLIALPETDGRPHPQSAAELKIYTLIQADADLRPLFAFNRMVPDLPLLAARADLLWRTGRLVVEIDGPEHRGAAKYRADRRRDTTLMLAGWRVLRMTNEDIITDAALALETIRDVVRLVQGEDG